MTPTLIPHQNIRLHTELIQSETLDIYTDTYQNICLHTELIQSDTLDGTTSAKTFGYTLNYYSQIHLTTLTLIPTETFGYTMN